MYARSPESHTQGRALAVDIFAGSEASRTLARDVRELKRVWKAEFFCRDTQVFDVSTRKSLPEQGSIMFMLLGAGQVGEEFGLSPWFK